MSCLRISMPMVPYLQFFTVSFSNLICFISDSFCKYTNILLINPLSLQKISEHNENKHNSCRGAQSCHRQRE